MSSPGFPLRPKPILPWRIVAGGFLHFVLPVYLIALLCDFVVAHSSSTAAWSGRVPGFTLRFLAIYCAVAVTVSLGAALADPLLRRARARRIARTPIDEAERSRHHLAEALAAGRGAFGGEATELLGAIAQAPWDHADPAWQALARDLAGVTASTAAALRSAASERRAAIDASALAALRHIDAARRQLEAERGAADEQAALTAARYVELRYGSDFASGRD